MDKFSNFLNYLAASIIGVTVLGVLILSFIKLSKDDVRPQTIRIEVITKSDSLSKNDNSNIQQLDTLLQGIKLTSEKIQDKQLRLLEEKEDNNFFNRLYTAIIAIILAIAGFFGFKSISEIKQRAISDAKEQAKFVANREFDNIFDNKYRASVLQESTEALSTVLKKELVDLEERIAILEQNTSNSSTSNTTSSEDIDETENPFGDE